VRQVKNSIADLDAEVQAVLNDPLLGQVVSIIGPDYSTGGLAVGFRDGVNRGAVYLANSDGSATAVGVISGSNDQGVAWTNCRNYFTPISYVASDWGGAIRLG